jgi:hypothetical protein
MFRTEARGGAKYKKSSVGDLYGLLHSILARVQKRFPEVIGKKVDVPEEYSASRSMRRGATLEAKNAKIPKEVIEANNRWRKHMRSRGLTPGMSMMERYPDAKASVPSLIRFSRTLWEKLEWLFLNDYWRRLKNIKDQLKFYSQVFLRKELTDGGILQLSNDWQF